MLVPYITIHENKHTHLRIHFDISMWGKDKVNENRTIGKKPLQPTHHLFNKIYMCGLAAYYIIFADLRFPPQYG